jgi:DNA-binding LacI/PurR family transcriptional regulator
MAQRNIRIPEDISLVGFDDYAWMRATAPPITAMRQDVERIAAEAWATIRARMDNPAAIARHVRLPCELILRNSTKRIGLPIRRIATGEEPPKARPRRKTSARQPKA